ncbi:hypothetical protein MPDQ_002250 [Monascus purpureus]|uniref:Uncharacterized protein n=1 Tax=Monascus purpureus TaxID=5098 RepID=A0A507R0D9_MONPU|nr:hypothetical protein MPDQ_002250 [Monascus purpureus]BDD59962.1 hypothetical protein MAP00_005129 [Monascus purpureus]
MLNAAREPTAQAGEKGWINKQLQLCLSHFFHVLSNLLLTCLCLYPVERFAHQELFLKSIGFYVAKEYCLDALKLKDAFYDLKEVVQVREVLSGRVDYDNIGRS